MKFHLYSALTRGDAKNCRYPVPSVITDGTSLAKAVQTDYVCARYRGDYRGIKNFLEADCLPFDTDNDHSENPADWVTPEQLRELLPDVAFAVHYSRNHMKEKNGHAARPKFHVFFPIPLCSDAEEYAALKQRILELCTFFDSQALDAARFFFGTEEAEVEFYPGSHCITDVLAERATVTCADRQEEKSAPAAADAAAGNAVFGFSVDESREAPDDAGGDGASSANGTTASSSFYNGPVIPEGERNSTLHRYLVKVLKRYGITQRAYNLYLVETQRCAPPLEDDELRSIWESACKFYQTTIAAAPDYVAPEDYADPFGKDSLQPPDYSDIGQAKVLTREYGEELLYTDGTDYLRYDGKVWVESRQRATGAMEEFLDLQLANAEDQLHERQLQLIEAGIPKGVVLDGPKAIEKALDTEAQEAVYRLYTAALTYRTFVCKRRDLRFVLSALGAAKPMLERNISALDAQPFLLNTPEATYDLRRGLDGARAHDPADLLTCITSVSPGESGREEWQAALDLFFCRDKELIAYVQEIAGLAAIGKIYFESLIIAYGSGRNGKSTFFNAISRVLGSYSGQISSDALVVGCKRNIKPEMAELRGKRFVIAAELEEGMRLNTSIVKQLCSTDAIEAEKKYRDPFSFTPTHTLVLFTNHLPRVGASDEGTWRRLTVIPFLATIPASGDRRNYADDLVNNCGEAILAWIIEGAQRIIARDFRLVTPKCVSDAIDTYRNANDWFNLFLADECETDPSYRQKSGELYTEYRTWCERNGEHTRRNCDFVFALDHAGYRTEHTRTGSVVFGLRLKNNPFNG